MFLLIMFLSNILLCTMFLFINYINIPIGVYVSLSYSNLSDLLICYREQVLTTAGQHYLVHNE